MFTTLAAGALIAFSVRGQLPAPPFKPDCEPMDLIFLLDETCGCGSSGMEECERYKTHIKSVISSLDTGNRKTRIGIIGYHGDDGFGRYTTVYNELGRRNGRQSRILAAVDMMNCSASSLFSLARKGFDEALDQFDKHSVRVPPVVKKYILWYPRCKPDERSLDEAICSPVVTAGLNLQNAQVLVYASGGCVMPERYRCLSGGEDNEWKNCDYDSMVYYDDLSEILMKLCPVVTTSLPSPSPTFVEPPPRVTSEGCPSDSLPTYGPLRPNRNCRNQGSVEIEPEALEDKKRFKLIDKCWVVLDNLFYDPQDELMRFDWHCTGRGCSDLDIGITEVLMIFEDLNTQLSYPYLPMVEHDQCLTVQDADSPLPHIISYVQVCFE